MTGLIGGILGRLQTQTDLGVCAGETGAVADRQNGRVSCAQRFIDNDAVAGFEAGVRGQGVVGLNADAHEDQISRIGSPCGGHCGSDAAIRAGLEAVNAFAEAQVDAL
ncbi:hypothetical protein SRABI128_06556 [Microbacterium sp. Bi128]|nr:hypothetical protein SRABI128_06556 [Microbacterium sp. Bi128]